MLYSVRYHHRIQTLRDDDANLRLLSHTTILQNAHVVQNDGLWHGDGNDGIHHEQDKTIADHRTAKTHDVFRDGGDHMVNDMVNDDVVHCDAEQMMDVCNVYACDDVWNVCLHHRLQSDRLVQGYRR